MTREELLKELRKLQGPEQDTEVAHGRADTLLLGYINDPEITREYDKIEKWYA